MYAASLPVAVCSVRTAKTIADAACVITVATAASMMSDFVVKWYSTTLFAIPMWSAILATDACP
jgi:hypothetical protein